MHKTKARENLAPINFIFIYYAGRRRLIDDAPQNSFLVFLKRLSGKVIAVDDADFLLKIPLLNQVFFNARKRTLDLAADFGPVIQKNHHVNAAPIFAAPLSSHIKTGDFAFLF